MWRGIYTAPGNLAVGKARGRKFRHYVPELPVGRKSPGRTSGQNLWDPSREENPKCLSQNSPEIFQGWNFRPGGRNFRATGNFRGELPGRSFGTPPERDPKNDLAIFSLGRNFRPKAGTSDPERAENHSKAILFSVFDLFTFWA